MNEKVDGEEAVEQSLFGGMAPAPLQSGAEQGRVNSLADGASGSPAAEASTRTCPAGDGGPLTVSRLSRVSELVKRSAVRPAPGLRGERQEQAR